VKLATQKLSKYYADVTAMTGLLLISVHILNPFWNLQLFRKWDNGMVTNSEDEIFYISHYQKAFLKYAENEYFAKHRRVLVNQLESITCSNLVRSARAS
jgi:hypothetical protein